MRRSPPIKCHCNGPCVGAGTQADYARHADVEHRTVRRWLDDGKIPLLADGRLDFTAADDARKRTVGSSPGWGADGDDSGDGPSYAIEQARHERAKADLAELKVQQLRGELVPAADTERAWFAVLRAMRNRVQALPDALAGELVALARDAADVGAAEHGVRTRLAAEVHRALEAAAGDVDAMTDSEEATDG